MPEQSIACWRAFAAVSFVYAYGTVNTVPPVSRFVLPADAPV
jgi:hypothetical protein